MPCVHAYVSVCVCVYLCFCDYVPVCARICVNVCRCVSMCICLCVHMLINSFIMKIYIAHIQNAPDPSTADKASFEMSSKRTRMDPGNKRIANGSPLISVLVTVCLYAACVCVCACVRVFVCACVYCLHKAIYADQSFGVTDVLTKTLRHINIIIKHPNENISHNS